MKITTQNYFTQVKQIGVKNLPEALQKSHELVVKASEEGNNWNTYYKSEAIFRVINLYFTKLEEYIKPHTEKAKEKDTIKGQKPQKAVPKDRKPTKKPNQNKKPTGKLVEHLSEEVKFIKRFVGLHQKVKTPSAILSFIKALQRAIIQKQIRKTSPYAKDIEWIQDKLISSYNQMKGETLIEIGEEQLAKFVAIAGGEAVYPSIRIIKRFVGMQEKALEGKKLDVYLKQIENAITSEKIDKDDPYREKVKEIKSKLEQYRDKTIPSISVSHAELNGLKGIIKACGCKGLGKIYKTGGKKFKACKKKTYSDAKRKGACSHNKGLSGIVTAEELSKQTYEDLDFNYPWNQIIGKPASNFDMMLHGEPGSGKTTLLLKFAKYLADHFGKTLYVSSEEFGAKTLTDMVNRLLLPVPKNLHFAKDLKGVEVRDYSFIILDSINDLGLNLEDYKALRAKAPNTAFILVLQQTKAGEFKGGKEWEHEVEISGRVESGEITIYKNRYGVKSSLNFFEEA